MKKLLTSMTVLLVLTLGFAGIDQSAQDLFQKALAKERAEGNLEGAIALYQKTVEQAQDKALAAKAQLRIGLCYEKLGNAKAVKAYEVVLNRFPKQAESVAEARVRLAALRKEEPAGLSVTRLPEIHLEGPTLSPDGTKVAGTYMSIGQNLAVYDLATKKIELMTNYKFGEKNTRWTWVPVWSPTGRELVHQDCKWDADEEHELWITNLDGKSRFLFRNPKGGLAPCDWLPDGSAVLAILGKEDKTSSLGLISVKEGSFRELCPLQRTYNIRGNMPSSSVSGSADASPDGRLIVFSDGPSGGGRDIYVIAAEGGSPVILTDHPADDREPRWSPDGRHIVFLSVRHGSLALWGVAVQDGKPNGQPFMIQEGMQNSQLLTWTRNGLFFNTFARILDVYTLEIDPKSLEARGKPRVLDFTPAGMNYFPRWSPDGKHLAFFSIPGSQTMTGEQANSFFVVMPSEGGKSRKFSRTTDWHGVKNLQAGSWQWLPDSSGPGFVLLDKEQHLTLARLELDTGEWKINPIPAAGFSSLASNITWSGDGKSFFIIKKVDDGSERGITRVDLETGQEHCLFRMPLGRRTTLNASRDYKRLVMGRGGKIVLVDVETGHAERLEYKKGLKYPVWSPDGKHLVVIGESNEKNASEFEIFIISPPDGQLKSLNISRYLPRGSRYFGYWPPDWSPDGRKIVFNTITFTGESNLIRNLLSEK